MMDQIQNAWRLDIFCFSSKARLNLEYLFKLTVLRVIISIFYVYFLLGVGVVGLRGVLSCRLAFINDIHELFGIKLLLLYYVYYI